MPIMPYILIYLALSLSLLKAESFVAENPTSMLDSPFFTDAVRFHEMGAADIVYFSRFDSSTPLFFPKALALHECLDNSALKFYSLHDLARNPMLLNKRVHSQELTSSYKSLEPPASKVFVRERKVFDSTQLLIPRRRGELASDEQLNEFLSKKRKTSYNEETQKRIIENLLRDEYANQPVAGFLGHAARENLKVAPQFSHSPINLKPSTYSNPDRSLPSLRQPIPIPQKVVINSSPKRTKEIIDNSHIPSSTSLNFIARKQSRDGTIHPAQASEIYLTTQDLKELLQDLSKDPLVAGEVRSVAEMWAKAEKNVSQNPEIALGVKSILLSAKVGRARTDPYGNASMENVSPDDKYFVIGIDKDVETNVVTIWSKEVDVEPGENLVELSSTDVIYQE
jgi:hypothetical protein